MPILTLNGRPYSLERLFSPLQGCEQADLTPYELNTLRFCQEWLAGQQEFSIKTSGSTGEPKVITLNRAQMIASARLTGQALALRSGYSALVCLSTEYIAGLMMLVRGFELGLSLTVITPSRNPLANLVNRVSFDFCAFSPLQLQEILNSGAEQRAVLDRMRVILVGGAAVDEALERELRTLRVAVYHTYGMTETVSHIALKRLNGAQASDYFVALKGVELGLSLRGCLTIRPSALTADRTLVTHDLVELRADNSFRWLGRIDNIINSGGIKVQAEKVESAMKRLFQDYKEGILAHRRLLVGPQEHPRLGQAVTVVIEGQPLAPELQADICQQLLQHKLLTKYEIPRNFCFRPHFLETRTGKLDRRANLMGSRFS
jgi:O-succinylbenzoic acid--CoA ligase